MLVLALGNCAHPAGRLDSDHGGVEELGKKLRVRADAGAEIEDRRPRSALHVLAEHLAPEVRKPRRQGTPLGIDGPLVPVVVDPGLHSVTLAQSGVSVQAMHRATQAGTDTASDAALLDTESRALLGGLFSKRGMRELLGLASR
jgi:hypothetical protein